MASPQAIQQWAGPRRVDRYRNLCPGQDGTAAPMVLRVAWAGRTSTYDQQDPTLSLPRQLRKSQEALPSDAVITVHFYDIESGRKELAERGHGRAHEQFQIPIPRDGGIADLLEEAGRRDRRFDAVICESIDRIARRAYIATEIEHQLEQAGVRLLAADEPITAEGCGGKPKATQVLTRRLKQGVAEWYVIELLEKSWGGFEVHTEAGYNVGKPCYGYRALKVPHPVPAKRAKGVHKTRLEVHPVEGPVVSKMFTWRVTGRLGYHAIADRLNSDLTANPPARPGRSRPRDRTVDLFQRARRADQPQVHRAHGVEPPRPQGRRQEPGQPRHRMGLVPRASPRGPGRPRDLRASPADRRTARTVPDQPGY